MNWTAALPWPVVLHGGNIIAGHRFVNVGTGTIVAGGIAGTQVSPGQTAGVDRRQLSPVDERNREFGCQHHRDCNGSKGGPGSSLEPAPTVEGSMRAEGHRH